MFDVNWGARSHAEIWDEVSARSGEGFTDAGASWNGLAHRLSDVATAVERATAGIRETRSGVAADAAGGAVGPMGSWVDQARGLADAVGSVSHEQSRAFDGTVAAMPAPVAVTPTALSADPHTWEGVFGGDGVVGGLVDTDADVAEQGRADAERQARELMTRYQDDSALRTATLPQFVAPEGSTTADVGVTPDAGPAGGAGVGAAGAGAAGVGAAALGAAGLVGRRGAGPGSAGPGSAGPGSAGGGATSGPPDPPSTAIASGGKSPRSATPTGAGGSPAGTPSTATGSGGATGSGEATASGEATGSGEVAGRGAAGAAGAAGSGTGAGSRIGTGSRGAGPAGASDAADPLGSGARTGTGSGDLPGARAGTGGAPVEGGPGGTAGGSAGSAGGVSGATELGPGVRTGAGVLEPAVGRPGAGVGAAGVGAAGEAGRGGMPFLPMGGGVGGRDAGEHRRADYLREDDPDAITGVLPPVVPPVIGG